MLMPQSLSVICASASTDVSDHFRLACASRSSSAAIPRLISVAEIIKREYLKNVEVQPLMPGLHQYNYLDHYEETVSPSNEVGKGLDAEALRSLEIIAALEGKNQ